MRAGLGASQPGSSDAAPAPTATPPSGAPPTVATEPRPPPWARLPPRPPAVIVGPAGEPLTVTVVRPVTQPPALSVVIAHYQRGDSLLSLLGDLDRQVLGVAFEVIVVDDGSEQPFVASSVPGFALKVVRRPNGGPGAARHSGIFLADAPVIVLVDDDMHLAPDFLACHVAAREAGADVVLGRIALEPDDVALFERFHVKVMDQIAPTDAATGGPGGLQPSEGRWLCTGNVSFRRADYDAIGGFDLALRRCEDRDLGIRLEAAGLRVMSSVAAVSMHRSDHRDVDVWRRRNEVYGRSDAQIGAKFPALASASPFVYLPDVPTPARQALLLAAVAPWFGRVAGTAVYALAELVDRRRERSRTADRLAVRLATLTYGLDYFAGVGRQSGTGRQALRAWRSWKALAARSGR